MANDLKLEVLLKAIDKVTAPLRAITRGSGDMARALKASRDQLKQLNQQQRDVQAFKAMQQELASNAKALDEARAKVTAYQGALERQRTVQQGIAAEVKVHRAAVRNLQKALIEAKEPSAELNRQYALAKDHLQKLEATYGKSNNHLRQLKRELKDAGTATANLNAKNQTLSERLTSAQGKLTSAGISTERLGNEEASLASKIEATNAAMSQQEERLRRITAQQQRLASAKQAYQKSQQLAGNLAMGGAASLANGYALSRPLASAVEAFAPAEDAATQLKVSMMDARGQVSEDFAKISALATQLGDRLPGTTAQYQEMMTMLRRQGISAQSILGGTGEAAAYLAVQLKMPADQAAEFAAKMQDSTRTAEGDMMGLMDTIQRTFYLGVDPNNMLNGFAKLSPALSILRKSGLDATNTLAPLLVMMDQTGMAGESAGNALRKVFQSGLDLTKVAKANKEIKQLGISLDFTNGKGEFGGLDHLFGQLDKLKKLTSVQRTSVLSTIFGDDAETLQVVQTLMDKGVAGYREVADKMKTQAELRTRVNEQLATLTNVMDAAAGSWTNAKAEFGAAVAPELKELIQSLGNMANRVGAWARENPKLAATLIKVTAGIGALSVAGGSLAIGLAGLIGPFALVKFSMATLGIKSLPMLGLLTKLGAAFRGVSIALWGLAMNPAALAIAGVIALIAGGAYLIWNNWDVLGPKFSALWDGIKVGVSSLWADIKAGFSGGIGGISALILNFSPLGLFYRALAGTLNFFGLELPLKFTEFGANIVQGLINGLAQMFPNAARLVGEFAAKLPEPVRKALGIHSPSRVFAEIGGFTMAGLEQGLRQGQANQFSALDDTAKGVMQKGKEISSANPFAALGGAAAEAPGKAGARNPFAALAKAGALAAGMGAAVMPAAADQIAIDRRPPLAAARAPAAMPAPGNITITVNAAPGMDEAALARLVGQTVQAELRRVASQQAAGKRSALYDRE